VVETQAQKHTQTKVLTHLNKINNTKNLQKAKTQKGKSSVIASDFGGEETRSFVRVLGGVAHTQCALCRTNIHTGYRTIFLYFILRIDLASQRVERRNRIACSDVTKIIIQ
jgi:hypothetical protein